MSVLIRPYKVGDRQAVRTISCDVANRGMPIDQYFPPRDVTADMLTLYYTDYEPASSIVAEVDGHVVGYLNGSVDNRAHGLVFFWLILPPLLVKALVRGIFWDKYILEVVKTVLKNWPRLLMPRKSLFNSHCGHFHIGVIVQYRQQRIGEELVAAFAALALKRHLQWISASVHGANIPATHFFQRLGFALKASYPMIGLHQGQEEKYQSLQYVKKLS